jgi:glycosyltransferase involved in cell wall biosynthesis
MKSPYRVLHVIDHLGSGGAQEIICQLVKYSHPGLFHPEVLALRSRGYYMELLRSWGVPVYSLFPEDHKMFKCPGGLSSLLVSKLFLFLTERRYDLVHTHLLWSNMFATPMAALCRVPVRFNHDQAFDFTRYRSVGNRGLRAVSNRLAHHIIAGSESIRNFLCRAEKVPPAKVSIIYNSVDLEQLNPAIGVGEKELWRRTWGIPQDALVVGGIGRLDPQKNFPLFLEVAAELSVQFPQAMFVIAGDGNQREHLEDLARKLGIGQKVRFLGFVKELRELYLSMNLLLFPSLFEGTPLTIFGALAMGLPVVLCWCLQKTRSNLCARSADCSRTRTWLSGWPQQARKKCGALIRRSILRIRWRPCI